jgi:hypothetical protein
MKITVEPMEFSLWMLFVHDWSAPCCVRDYDLEEKLNQLAEAYGPDGYEAIEFVSPSTSGLYRWKLRWKRWNDPMGDWIEREGERPHSAVQAKRGLPEDLVVLVDHLDKQEINVNAD